MEILWAAATIKLVGPGLDDDAFLERVSRLVGDHDVATRALHYGSGSRGENISLRRQRILPPEELRQLPKGTAVLFATGARPALIELQPWYPSGPLASRQLAPGLRLEESIVRVPGGHRPAVWDGP